MQTYTFIYEDDSYETQVTKFQADDLDHAWEQFDMEEEDNKEDRTCRQITVIDVDGFHSVVFED